MPTAFEFEIYLSCIARIAPLVASGFAGPRGAEILAYCRQRLEEVRSSL
jgi:hypothetical protein